MSKKEEKDSLFCSFCGKSQKEVKKLIAGPTVFVCDECVDVERVVKAILDFHACDTGRGCDLDAIFNSL